MRHIGGRCEKVEGECNKGVHHTITTDVRSRGLCVGTDREDDDDKDGQGDQSVEAEVSRHNGKGGGSKHCMRDKEGHRLKDWKQFGRDLEGCVQVPLCAELGHRQEAGSETSEIWKKRVVGFSETPLFRRT